MARSSQNTTINHHDDRRKTQQSTIMKDICCPDEPTEERDAVMARSSQTQQSTITKAICCPDEPTEGCKHNNQPSRRPRVAVANTTINHYHEGHGAATQRRLASPPR
jgi:hypothetical protein